MVERTGALRFPDGSSRNKLYMSESEPLISENLAYLMRWLVFQIKQIIIDMNYNSIELTDLIIALYR
jgi:hypothetical protein